MNQKAYATLADNGKELGCQLPSAVNGSIRVVSEVVDQQALAELFGGLDFDAGWASYRDKTVIDNRCTDLNNLLEGEWASSAFTLRVRLVDANRYQVTRFTNQADADDSITGTERVFMTRNSLNEGAKYNGITYRLWWQQAKTGPHEGRWVPLGQQFIGFTRV